MVDGDECLVLVLIKDLAYDEVDPTAYRLLALRVVCYTHHNEN